MIADEESKLQRQARHRLIGAVALTTFVVVTLPLVFDSEPPPALNPHLQLRIAGEPVEPPVVQSAVAASQPVPAALPTVAAEAVPVSAAASAVIAPPVVAKAEPAPALTSKTASEPSAKAEKPKTAPSPAPRGSYVLQIGAYSSAETAKNMQVKLTKLGYRAYTEKTGANVRVRVGGFSSREAADKARQKLLAQGLHPNIVHLD